MDEFVVYPAIDLRGGKVVRLAQGDLARQTVYGDDPAAVAHENVFAVQFHPEKSQRAGQCLLDAFAAWVRAS